MPDLSHLWQRFVLAMTLVFGLLVGIAATIFGYSNTNPVTIGFSTFHLSGVPLWTVAIVPLALALVVGTLYHWWNSLHHFTEHMRHRRRVRELESEVTSLKAHLDQLLEMPDHGATPLPATTVTAEAKEPQAPLAAALPSAGAGANGADKAPKRPAGRKRVSLPAVSEPVPEPAGVAANGDDAPAPEASEEANSEA